VKGGVLTTMKWELCEDEDSERGCFCMKQKKQGRTFKEKGKKERGRYLELTCTRAINTVCSNCEEKHPKQEELRIPQL